MKQSHQSRLALGSDCTLVLVADVPTSQLDQLFGQLWSMIFQFERQFSRFIPESELSQFNRSAGLKLGITPEFKAILRVAKQLSQATDGLYNPFILPALQRAGYTQSHVPQYRADSQESYADRSVVSAEELRIDGGTATIPYGTAIDLGGCGKGYLADLLAASVPDWVSGFWFSLGGDVVGQGVDAAGQPWQVVVSDGQGHLEDQGWYIQTSGQRFAVATSGTGLRAGTKQGKRWHHIIDPRTLQPSTSDCQLATVYGDSGVKTDVLASCAIILGSAQAVPFLKRQGMKAALVQTNGLGSANQTAFGSALHRKRAKRRQSQGVGHV